MRVGIDARFWSEQGHGRYIRNLISELAKIDQDNQYVIFLRKDDFEKFQIPNSRFQKRLAEVRWYTLKEQTMLLAIFLKENLDLLHVPHFNIPVLYPKPIVITIHDLTITYYPTIRATTLPYPVWKFKRIMYHVVLRTALMRAKKIIAVSNFTKNEIRKYYPQIPDEKIVVTHEAVEQAFIEKADQYKTDSGQARMTMGKIKKTYDIKKQYLIYVGNVHPHKNIERLIRVFHKLQKDLSGNVQLVLVGKDDYFMDRLKHETCNMKQETNIIWTGFVPEADLPRLIKGAAAFVFPSLMEGFGIPPLEAMAVGTPTIVSNTTSLPEVCGDASEYFDPASEDDMYAKIKSVLEDADLRLSLVQKGYERVKQFSWNRMAQQTQDLYVQLTS